MSVHVWEEVVMIPTYSVGEAEKNPMFLEKRVYQGSSGAIFPYPVIEKVEDEKRDKPYKAVYLENEYIKVMVLPELGGRVQMAYDKVAERHFIYYNRVIKPALVGLTGPWVSGGIEFNWPQHHRPSTFMPIDYTVEQLTDGGATVWVSERERMFHQKGMAGFTLRPGCAVLEIQGRLYNPTPLPQTFLWWANPAVAVNDHYQSVFPADVNAVFDHGKRDVSTYPIATGVYYKVDYSAGVDISRYKNIPVPTSYMAIRSKYDFVGGYENDTKAGLLHVANHHLSPGKKQWTWGHGDFGQAWDRNLTDEDGPYIELMTGVFTDNQPDFSWLQPYEEKAFTQYFLPYRELGVVKNACADLLMNIEPEGSKAILKLFATSEQTSARIVVTSAGTVCLDTVASLSPKAVSVHQLEGVELDRVEVAVYRADGKLLLGWKAESYAEREVPSAAKAAFSPEETGSTEQLYLTGLHLEQYRHATYLPTDYYEEALRRDPSDVRNNNALGLWLVRKGQFAKAESYLRRAVETLTERNPNPYDGEPLYNLGLCLAFQEKYEEAYTYFYKATWNGGWQDVAFFALAQLSALQGNFDNALHEIDRALIRNWHNHRARHLKTTVLRKLNRTDEAASLATESLKIDPFNFGCLFENYLLNGKSEESLAAVTRIMRTESHNYLELMLDYLSSGCWEEVALVADTAMSCVEKADPMMGYYKAWAWSKLGRDAEARQVVAQAEAMSPDYCFPNRLEAIAALNYAQSVSPAPKALYYLGNLWYDKRQYPEAIAAWEGSMTLDDRFATVLRNLSLAYFNKQGRKEEARRLLERAFELNTNDARVLMELDQLYKRLNVSHQERLSMLDTHRQVAFRRDDLYLEYATLLNNLGRVEEAMAMIDARLFHPWEGGEGKVPAQYQLARVERVKALIGKGEYKEALPLIEQCYVYPHNLGEGKLSGAQENDFDYYHGVIREAMGQEQEALRLFRRASTGNSRPSAAMYYNDQKPDKIFYQGLALIKQGKHDEARSRFQTLIDYGKQHLDDRFKMDYFAVSLPDLQIWEDDMDKKNRIHCHYLQGLGYLGLEQPVEAEAHFAAAAALDNNHQGVMIHRRMVALKSENILR